LGCLLKLISNLDTQCRVDFEQVLNLGTQWCIARNIELVKIVNTISMDGGVNIGEDLSPDVGSCHAKQMRDQLKHLFKQNAISVRHFTWPLVCHSKKQNVVAHRLRLLEQTVENSSTLFIRQLVCLRPIPDRLISVEHALGEFFFFINYSNSINSLILFFLLFICVFTEDVIGLINGFELVFPLRIRPLAYILISLLFYELHSDFTLYKL